MYYVCSVCVRLLCLVLCQDPFVKNTQHISILCAPPPIHTHTSIYPSNPSHHPLSYPTTTTTAHKIKNNINTRALPHTPPQSPPPPNKHPPRPLQRHRQAAPVAPLLLLLLRGRSTSGGSSRDPALQRQARQGGRGAAGSAGGAGRRLVYVCVCGGGGVCILCVCMRVGVLVFLFF